MLGVIVDVLKEMLFVVFLFWFWSAVVFIFGMLVVTSVFFGGVCVFEFIGDGNIGK